MKELDLLVGLWAKKNILFFDTENCLKFENSILSIETIDLYNLIIK